MSIESNAPRAEHRPEDAQEGWDLLREMRRQADGHGITQRKLGRRLGISQSRISALENRKGNEGDIQGPTYELLKRVARACDLNLEVRLSSVEDEEYLSAKGMY